MSIIPSFSPRAPNPRRVEEFTEFVRGLIAARLKMSGNNGDLLMIGADGFVTATDDPTGDYTFTSVVTINGTDVIVEVDNLQLLSRDATRNLIGLNTIAGSPVFVGNDPPAVAAERLGKVDLTTQTANIASTALSNTPPAGFYEVEVYIETTTADAAAGTLAVTVSYTDDVGATTATVIAAHALTATGRSTGRQLVRLASGNINYTVTVTGIYGTSAYAIFVRVVALG